MPKTSKIGDTEVQMDRRFKTRRNENIVTDIAAAIPEEAPPRRKKQRRRQIDPTTCEREYSDDEVLFMHAMDAYKRSSGRMFPTCSEILEVVRGLGYTKLTPEERTLLEIHGISAATPCEASSDESNND
ncbi:MAG: hypothetical protein SFV81_07650 [Pirellulaceae bacterium]|nr:hypothetical protein [Pirellulaceae bacterium]